MYSTEHCAVAQHVSLPLTINMFFLDPYSFLSTTVSVATTTTTSGPTTPYRHDVSVRCQRSSPVGTNPTNPTQSRPKWRRSTGSHRKN